MKRQFLLLLVIAVSASCFAQTPPPNDDCVNAVPITVSTSDVCNNSVSSSTVTATQSMAPCIGTAANDVWFSFTASNAEQVIMLTRIGIVAPIMEVFSGSCGSLVSLGCFNDQPVAFGNEYRRKITGLTTGNTYYIRVYSNTATGSSFSLCIFEPAANDDCANAIDIPINTGLNWTTVVSGNNLNNSNSGAVCNSVNRADGWFKFTATDSVHVLYISGPTQSAFRLNTKLQVYSGTCGALTVIDLLNNYGTPFDCWDAAVSDGYKTIRGLTPGNTYYINIMQDMTFAIIRSNDFNIAISNVPANDGFTGAQTVAVNTGTTVTSSDTGNFHNATSTIGVNDNGCFSGETLDLWYKFTATSNHHTILASFFGSNSVPALVIYALNSGNLVPVVCASGVNIDRFVDYTAFTPATEYYIRVKAGVDDFEDHLISLAITTPPATHPNEDCATATTLPFDDLVLSTTRDAGLATTINGGCNLFNPFARDLWYGFTPPMDASAVLKFTAPHQLPFVNGNDAGIELYTGNCAAPTRIDCSNMPSTGISNLAFTATSGTTYYVRVFSMDPEITPFTLSFTQFVRLPVTITAFKGIRTAQGSVRLTWDTEEESGISYYDVERSENGFQFKQLDRVAARNIPAPSRYASEDMSPLPGVSYYRLKIVNQDGKVEYSRTVKMDIADDITGNLQVSRRGSSIMINNSSTTIENITVNIFTATGQRIYSATRRIAGGSNEISLPGKNGGPLLVQIIKEDNSTKTFKIY